MSTFTTISRWKHAEWETLKELRAGVEITLHVNRKRRTVSGGTWATVAGLEELRDWELVELIGSRYQITERGRQALADDGE